MIHGMVFEFPSYHPSDAELFGYVERTLPIGGAAGILDHLLIPCARCKLKIANMREQLDALPRIGRNE